MDTKQRIEYVTSLLNQAAVDNNWEAAIRFTFVLSLLRQDLIAEQESELKCLRKTG